MLNRCVCVIAVIVATAHAVGADPVPDSRRTDWAYTGVPGGIPHRTSICATFSPGTTAAIINAAIASCSSAGGGVVLLTAGVYDITGVKIQKSNVTLRGAGADKTVLRGGNIVDLGSGNPTAVGIAITGGGAKGTRTFTVATTSGLSAGQMIEMDRDDDPSVVVSTKGGSRHMRQVNRIVSIDGATIVVENPLFVDFAVGNPAIRYTFTYISFSGIEDLKLDHSSGASGANFRWTYCYGCWVTGLESYKPAGFHMMLTATLNIEIRDSFIHDAQTYGPNNAGMAAYGSDLYGSNSSGKIENNIFDRVFPGIEMQNSSSGFYIGYNYGFASMSQSTDAPVTWMFTDNHGPHDMMNLWEGNVGELFGSDGYFGGSSHGTVVRNYFTGYNPLFGTVGSPVRFNRLSYYYNLIGNVLGSGRLNPSKYVEVEDGCGIPAKCDAVYRLGFPNIGNASLTDTTGNPVPGGMMYPDARVVATMLRWGNYDYFNGSTQWNINEVPFGMAAPADHAIPNSYYYSSRPAWFDASSQWPPIGPDVTGGDGDLSGHVHKIPAQLCWERLNLSSGGVFSAETCRVTLTSPAVPSNVRVVK